MYTVRILFWDRIIDCHRGMWCYACLVLHDNWVENGNQLHGSSKKTHGRCVASCVTTGKASPGAVGVNRVTLFPLVLRLFHRTGAVLNVMY